MILKRVSSEAEMVFEFLRAEYGSPTYRDYILGAGLSPSAIASLLNVPFSSNHSDNNIREKLLAYRGFPDSRIFENFSRNLKWSLFEAKVADVKTLRYFNCDPWNIAAPSLLVGDGAANLNQLGPKVPAILTIAGNFCTGWTCGPLIAVSNGISTTLLEGNTRATGFVLSNVSKSIEILIGQ